MRSDFFSLNWRDFGKGLFLAVLTAVLTYIWGVIQTEDFTAIDWKVVGSTALVTVVSYLLKNLVTNSEGEVLTKEKEIRY